MSGIGNSLIVLSAGVTVGMAALGTIGWLGRKAWKAIRRLTLFLDDYEGTPSRPGVDARPGVMERLKSQDEVLEQLRADLAAVVAEMPKNGVPLAVKIDALWSQHLAAEERLRIAAAATALSHPQGPTTTVVVQPANAPVEEQ